MHGARRPSLYLCVVPYEVRTAVFEGPLDLLLELITRREVDLYEVTLSSIVDAYLEELARMGPLDLDGATEFLVIAAILVELKSRWLLPQPPPPETDDDADLLEARDLLVARLLECMTFRSAGDALARLASAAGRSWPRLAGAEERFVRLAPDLLAGVEAAHLGEALRRCLAPRPAPRVQVDHIAPLALSVADVVAELSAALPARGPLTFRALTEGSGRMDVIVRFLALLELYKQGLVELEQATTFGTLEVRWVGPEVVASGQ